MAMTLRYVKLIVVHFACTDETHKVRAKAPPAQVPPVWARSNISLWTSTQNTHDPRTMYTAIITTDQNIEHVFNSYD